MKRRNTIGYGDVPGGKSALRRMRERFGAGNEAEAMRMALVAMLEGHRRLLDVLPAESVARRLADGSFGSAPELARRLVDGS